MNKNRGFLVFILSICFLVTLMSCKKEVRYNGRTLKQWMAELKSEDQTRSIQALGELGKIQPVSPEVVPAVLALHNESRNDEVRKASALTLGHLKDSRALDELIKLLKDPKEWRVGVEALKLYGEGAHPRLREILEALPKESNKLNFYVGNKPIFCSRALIALAQIGNLPKDTANYCKKLLSNDEDVRISSYDTQDWLIPCYCLTAISSCPDPDCLKILNEHLQFNTVSGPLGPFIAARGIGLMNDPAVEILDDLIKAVPLDMTAGIPGILYMTTATDPQDLKNKELVELIQYLLDWSGDYFGPTQRQEIRQEIDRFIKLIENHPGAPLSQVQPIMKSYGIAVDRMRRRAVILAIGAIGPKANRAVDTLRIALKDKSEAVREAARKSLAMIEK